MGVQTGQTVSRPFTVCNPFDLSPSAYSSLTSATLWINNAAQGTTVTVATTATTGQYTATVATLPTIATNDRVWVTVVYVIAGVTRVKTVWFEFGDATVASVVDAAADLQLRVRQIIGGSTSDDATATTLLWFSDQTSNYAVGTIIGINGYEARINEITFDGENTTVALNRSIPGIAGNATSFSIFGCPPDNTYSADIAAIVKGTRAVLASSTTSYTPSVGETTVSLLADWTIYAGQTMKRRSDGSEYLIVSVSTANVDPGYSTITISPGLIGNSTSDDVYYALANDRRNESGVAPLNVVIEGNSIQVTDQ